MAPEVIQPIHHQPNHQPVVLVNTFGIHTPDILWMDRLQVHFIQDRDQLNQIIYSQRERKCAKISMLSLSAAQNACINLGDTCGGITLYAGQYYLKRSVKFIASGPSRCWTKEEKWASNYIPRAEWVSL